MTASAVISIISAILAIARSLVDYAKQRQWMTAAVAEATLKGLQDADAAIALANKARDDARGRAVRDPASVLRDDDGFKRTD